MASKLEIKKHELSEFNNSTGNKYEENDGVQPDAINYTIENSEYAVKYSEALASQPDISEVSTEGTPSVSIVDNPDAGIDGAKKFKFSHLKGDKGNPVWVRYAQNNAGLGMTDTPTQDTKYIGFYVGSAASEQGSAYTWSKYVGKQPSSVVIEGTNFIISWDDSTSSTVSIDVSRCKVATPVKGIVTSVNGQDGAVVIKKYSHLLSVDVGTTSSNYSPLISLISTDNTPINSVSKLSKVLCGCNILGGALFPIDVYDANLDASSGTLSWTTERCWLVIEESDSGNNIYFVKNSSITYNESGILCDKQIRDADINDIIYEL